jgi:hypothetical protein
VESGIDDADLDEGTGADHPVDGGIHERGALEGRHGLAAGTLAATARHGGGLGLGSHLHGLGLHGALHETSSLLLGRGAGVVKRHLGNFTDLDHSSGSIGALASDNGDSSRALNGLRVPFVFILKVFFLDGFGTGHRHVDRDFVRLVDHLLDFARDLNALSNHGVHGHLFADCLGGIFNGCRATARARLHGDSAATAVHSSLGGSDDSHVFRDSSVGGLLHLSGLPLHLVDFDHLLTVPDGCSLFVAHLGSGHSLGLGDLDFADPFNLVSDGLLLPAGHVVALEGKDLGRVGHLWLGVALGRLASASTGLDGEGSLASGDLRSGHGAAASELLLRQLRDRRVGVLPSAGLGLGEGESCEDSD